MWNKISTGFSSFALILAFSVAVIFYSNTVDAQALWKISTNNPGPGGQAAPPTDNGSSTAPVFIAFGAVVVGYILYKVVFQNNDEPSDSSDTTSSLIPSRSNVINLQAESVIPENNPPVNLYLGIRRDNYNSPIEEKTYIVGVSLNF
jgi:hypothetical protein